MFWIYVSKDTATLHQAMCPDCNCGMGKDGKVALSGKWLGPYERLKHATPPEGTRSKACKKCRPTVDW